MDEELTAGAAVDGLQSLTVEPSDLSDVHFDLMGPGSQSFELVPSSDNRSVRLVASAALDREEQPQHDLIVRARSRHSPGAATCRLLVDVRDVNDHRPRFDADLVHLRVTGDAERGRCVGRVGASDADGDRVVYRLAEPSDVLVVEPQTGRLLLADADKLHKANRSLVVRVTAQDRGRPALDAEAPVTVVVESLPRREEATPAPTSDDAEVRVKRRAPRALRPTKRVEFSEQDGQPEGKLMFQLEKSAERETFKMRDDSPWVSLDKNGNVRVKRRWDYEELGPEKTIDFWVIITNAGLQDERSTSPPYSSS